MTDHDITRLAALAEAATPGPRTVRNEPFESGMPYFNINAGAGYWRGAPDRPGFQITAVMSQADADLAALAPETLTKLIRRLQAAEAERDSRTPSVVVLALHDEIDQTRATLSAAEAELAATRAAIAEWRKEHWAAAADTTLMETLDRIAQGILE